MKNGNHALRSFELITRDDLLQAPYAGAARSGRVLPQLSRLGVLVRASDTRDGALSRRRTSLRPSRYGHQ